ncbi:polyketide cyclase/dehydrase/lipid transport protein [Prauserella shujinwangii]|uniref:Polyketide cyclase/dehydrase/lipid transport protein n=1 Tax=Prauserella shujinwangii TaxID=1453103 RepID=A0A2T0LX86_9PSEU|nr:SRPBCC family protein [Prauserella shujinwangii]PRX48641.1 polyketide cyclase/dehydrase/lipid transport protein [Prauserella shujinwangii]
MAEFEHQRDIAAAPRAVFDVATDLRTIDSWSPDGVQIEESDATPGELRAWVSSGSEVYDAEGYVNVDAAELRLEWGSNDSARYEGWLQVEPGSRGDLHSVATLHITFGGKQPETLGGEFSEEVDRRIEESLDRLAALVAERTGA